MRIAEAARWGAAELSRSTACQSIAHDADLARWESECLLATILNYSKAQLHTWPERELPAAEELIFKTAIARRVAGEPFAYITGEREFYGIPFLVTPAVLIPRPETELLVEAVLSNFSSDTAKFALVDIGVGSGTILLSILATLRQRYGASYLKRGKGLGIDISSDALAVAQLNTAKLQLDENIELVQGDLLTDASFLDAAGTMNIVTANLPYVPSGDILSDEVSKYEPELALRSGVDGLDLIRRLLKDCGGLPAKLFLEFGKGQAPEVESLARSFGRNAVRFLKDLQGIERVAVIERSDGRSN